jgi:hypothetical protein
MKVLENLTNVEPASAEFPFGDLKNNTGTNNGTPVNRDLLTDLIQLGQKMASEAGITMNDVPDNEYDGWQLYEAFRKLTKPYKVYTATLNQTGTAAPVATVLRNELSGTPVWTRSGTGAYLLTLTGEFTPGKTFLICGTPTGTVTGPFNLGYNNVNEIGLNTLQSGSLTDGLLDVCAVEIRVYD